LEAEKLGFSKILVPQNNLKGFTSKVNIEIIQARKVEEAFRQLFS
jgi:DNA repair protein RadA/Sms